MIDAQRLLDANARTPSGPPLEIAEYKPTEAALAQLQDRFMGIVFDTTVPDGMRAAKEARNEIRSYRTALEKKRKELKEPALRRAKLIDEEAKFLTERIVALEQPIAQQIEAEEQRVENERRAREEAEQRRVQEIIGWINDIKLAPARVTGRPAASIEVVLASLTDRVIGDDFAEFQREAEGERVIAIATLTTMLAGARAQEVEAQKIAEERAELARLQKEAKERAEKDEADRKERIAAEERAAREQRAREDALAKAERERLDAEARATRTAEPVLLSSEHAALLADEDEEAKRVDEFKILLAAMKTLHEIVLPGSAEAEIVENALRQVGEL